MPRGFSEQLDIAPQTGIEQMIKIGRQVRIRAIGETGYRAIPTQQGQERLKLAHISGDRKGAQQSDQSFVEGGGGEMFRAETRQRGEVVDRQQWQQPSLAPSVSRSSVPP